MIIRGGNVAYSEDEGIWRPRDRVRNVISRMKVTDCWNRGCGHDSNDSGMRLGTAGVTVEG